MTSSDRILGSPAGFRRTAAWLVLLLAAGSTLLLGWHSLVDRDVWLHARAGRDILSDGRVPRVNTYSFTAPDHPWVDHEWLFQVLIGATAPTTGSQPDELDVHAWNVLRTGLGLLLVMVLLLGDGGYRALARGPDPARTVAVGMATMLGLGLLWTRLTLRPELLSYLLFVVVLRQLEAAIAGETPTGLHALRDLVDPRKPAGRVTYLTVFWAQIHGFAAVVAPLWLLAGIAAAADRIPGLSTIPNRRPVIPKAQLAVGGALVAAAALALTPNGLAGMLYPLRALSQFGPGRLDLGEIISELVPTLRTTDSLGTTILLFKISLVWSLLWIVGSRGRVPLLRILALAAAAAAALAGQRGLGFYAVAFILLHTGTVGEPRWSRPRLPWQPAPRTRDAAAFLFLAGLILVTGFWWRAITDDGFYLREGVARRWGDGLAPAHAPVEAAGGLMGVDCIRVVANVDAAGCLLALTEAALFIDGRTEAYPPALWRTYLDLRRGGNTARVVLREQRPDAVCLTLGGAFASLASELYRDPDWRLVKAGPAAVVYRPAGSVGTTADPVARAGRLLRQATGSGMPTARGADLCLAAANLLRLAGDTSGVAAALTAGALLRPDHGILRHNLGNVLLDQGNPAAALDHFEAALAANGRLAGAALNAGVCEVRLGHPDAALVHFRRAVDIDPRYFGAWANLGGLLAAQGDREAALAALGKAAALRPEDDTLRARIRQLQRQPVR